MSIAAAVNYIFELYFWIVLVRVLLSWFPNVDWGSQPLKTLALVTDCLLNPFKKIVPTVGVLDFSPFVAVLFLEFVQFSVVRLLVLLGL